VMWCEETLAERTESFGWFSWHGSRRKHCWSLHDTI